MNNTNKTVETILITGGCGFIGINTMSYMVNENICKHFIVVDNQTGGTIKDVENLISTLGNWEREEETTDNKLVYTLIPTKSSERVRIEIYIADILDTKRMDSLVQGVDTVIHLAGQTSVIPSIENPLWDLEQNVLGTVGVLEACRKGGVKRFILASSSAPLGDQTPPIDEQKVPRPLSPYGASKLACEGYCSAYYGSYGLETITLRFSNVYGLWSARKGSVVALFMRMILNKKPLTIYGDGNQSRDFIYTDDLSSAISNAVLTNNSEAFGRQFQIATCTETTVGQLAEKIANLARGSKIVDITPINYVEERKGEVLRSYSDIGLAKKLLGYNPKTDLDDGLLATWQWFVANQNTIKSD
ncbi:MAG: GDP-mannose 4,6-dehydratase [Magnetococcales bacterium]|nr:GDP-mannose 4,6-dehydratase [Magnetococcales bacterium]